jgi:hypothetical protein
MKSGFIAIFGTLFPVLAWAIAPNFQLLPSSLATMSADELQAIVSQVIHFENYRGVRVKMIADTQGNLHHLLVELQSKGLHRVDMAALYLDENKQITSTDWHYQLSDLDTATTQAAAKAATCPDSSVQFIAFAPNNDSVEQQVTQDVAAAAKAKGLKTISLLQGQATSQAYLNYMSCPHLVGNFYDGDANPQVFTTVDGEITSENMATLNFNYKVTNIWLACEAFNDPMLSAVTKDAKSQKYAAGINDLEVGPSDNTGKCAMIAAINGQPMTTAFHACYSKYDVSSDHWGFAGQGSDLFGH